MATPMSQLPEWLDSRDKDENEFMHSLTHEPTMTSVATVSEPRHAVAVHAENSFDSMLAMGEHLVSTKFLPDAITTGAQAAAIILAGRELGMQPMRALRSLRMVKGNVTESADSQLARFKTDGGRAEFQTLDDTRAVLFLIHPNGDKHTETFTIQDAVAAGLVSSGGMYQKYTKAMLRSRAITSGLKSLGWEGGAGTYDPSELENVYPTSQPVAKPAPTLPPTAATTMTDDQRAILEALLESSVFTDGERAGAMASASTETEAAMLIEQVHALIKERTK